jgi:hypothetical protein
MARQHATRDFIAAATSSTAVQQCLTQCRATYVAICRVNADTAATSTTAGKVRCITCACCQSSSSSSSSICGPSQQSDPCLHLDLHELPQMPAAAHLVHCDATILPSGCIITHHCYPWALVDNLLPVAHLILATVACW